MRHPAAVLDSVSMDRLKADFLVLTSVPPRLKPLAKALGLLVRARTCLFGDFGLLTAVVCVVHRLGSSVFSARSNNTPASGLACIKQSAWGQRCETVKIKGKPTINEFWIGTESNDTWSCSPRFKSICLVLVSRIVFPELRAAVAEVAMLLARTRWAAARAFSDSLAAVGTQISSISSLVKTVGATEAPEETVRLEVASFSKDTGDWPPVPCLTACGMFSDIAHDEEYANEHATVRLSIWRSLDHRGSSDWNSRMDCCLIGQTVPFSMSNHNRCVTSDLIWVERILQKCITFMHSREVERNSVPILCSCFLTPSSYSGFTTESELWGNKHYLVWNYCWDSSTTIAYRRHCIFLLPPFHPNAFESLNSQHGRQRVLRNPNAWPIFHYTGATKLDT